ncbi:MAG: DUF1385 domain-containing protein [Acidobacteriota bacterium]
MAAEKEILVGGQAVMEGVMMKLPESWALTVRRSNGDFVTKTGLCKPWSDRWPILKLPVLRGGAVLISTLILGMKCLFFSSDIVAADIEAEEQAKKDEDAGNKGGGKPTGGATTSLLTLANLLLLTFVTSLPDGTESDDEGTASNDASGAGAATAVEGDKPVEGGMRWYEIALSGGVALLLFLGLFKALPLAVAWGAKSVWPALGHPVAESLISGVALLCVFISYLWLVSRLPDIRRVFQYHGAEHKVVYLHENGGEREVAAAQEYSTFHPRCGTSFLVFMVATSILVWAAFPMDVGFLGKFLLRLALFPLIIGLSYEMIRLTARKRTQSLFKALLTPGLWTQRITTKPPDDSMVAVSLNSLALAEEVANGTRAPSD